MATAEQYGVDIDCLSGHGLSWSLASGSRNVANAIGRRLITPRGGLFYDPDYGFDTREYLGVALTRGKLAELIQGVESEALKDVRVQAVVASVTTTGNPSTSLTLELSVTLADGPTFDMIMSIQTLVPGAPVVSLTIDGVVVPQSGLVSAPDVIVTPPFTPLALGSTLKLWLRGDLGVTQSGGNVSAWADQSAQGNILAQASGGLQPTYVASAVGGKPGILGASGKYLASTVEPIAQNAARTIFLVLSPCSNTSNYPYSCRGTQGYSITFGTNLTFIETNNTSTNSTVTGSPPTSGTFYVFEVTFDGVTTDLMTCKINGAVQTVSNGVGTGVGVEAATTDLRVVNQYDATICEIIVCDTVLSAPNELLVKTYLSARYGIAVV